MAVLVVDTGSSSMRCVVFAEDGDVRFTARRQYTMDLGPDGRATMEARVFAEALTGVTAQAAAYCKENGLTPRALALTGQRSSVLAVDAQGRPLYPILMWYDKRSAPACAAWNEACGKKIYDTCGMRLTPVASAPKMHWLRENEPAIYEKAYKLVGIHDALLFLLTGEFATDASFASRSGLMNIRTLQWDGELCGLFGVEKEKLCRLLPPGSRAGGLLPGFAGAVGLPAGLPVISAGGDQQCCVLGQGVSGAGALSVNSGSATYIAAVTGQPVFDPGMEVNVNAYCTPGRYVCEASNMSSGTAYQWFFQTFYKVCGAANMEEMDREILASPASAQGMLCVPDFAGRGCPGTDPAARGMFLHIGLDATRGSFARALLEGICCDTAEAVQYLDALGLGAPQVVSSGGLTGFSVFNQVMAELLRRPVLVRRQRETTALGAFANALTALGDVKSPEEFFAGYRVQEQVFEPTPQGMDLYAALLERRKNVKEKLK